MERKRERGGVIGQTSKFNRRAGEEYRGEYDVMGRYGDMIYTGQMVVDFATRIEMAVVNTYFKKMKEHYIRNLMR